MGAALHLEPLDPEAALAAFRAGLRDAGAIVSFVGVARGTSKTGEVVTNLHLRAHPRLTLRSLETIAAAACERFEVLDVLVSHRAGDIAPGEPIVLAAAAAAHRRAAFEAADYLMDRLKSEAMFWKREDRAGGSEWIEPTAADAIDLARWYDPDSAGL